MTAEEKLNAVEKVNAKEKAPVKEKPVAKDKLAWLAIGTKPCGWLIGLCGAVLAFLLLFMGFWKTLLVALFFAVGYLFGSNNQKIVGIKNFINKIFPPKGE
jgi:uncharacterized membrane protein